MKVMRDDKSDTLTFVPVDSREEQAVLDVIAAIKPNVKLAYGGSEPDGDSRIVYFCAGARREIRRKTKRNVTISYYVHVGGVKLALRGSTDCDKNEIRQIHRTCFLGSGDGLIFIGEAVVDGKKAIVAALSRSDH